MEPPRGGGASGGEGVGDIGRIPVEPPRVPGRITRGSESGAAAAASSAWSSSRGVEPCMVQQFSKWMATDRDHALQNLDRVKGMNPTMKTQCDGLAELIKELSNGRGKILVRGDLLKILQVNRDMLSLLLASQELIHRAERESSPAAASGGTPTGKKLVSDEKLEGFRNRFDKFNAIVNEAEKARAEGKDIGVLSTAAYMQQINDDIQSGHKDLALEAVRELLVAAQGRPIPMRAEEVRDCIQSLTTWISGDLEVAQNQVTAWLEKSHTPAEEAAHMEAVTPLMDRGEVIQDRIRGLREIVTTPIGDVNEALRTIWRTVEFLLETQSRFRELTPAQTEFMRKRLAAHAALTESINGRSDWDVGTALMKAFHTEIQDDIFWSTGCKTPFQNLPI